MSGRTTMESSDKIESHNSEPRAKPPIAIAKGMEVVIIDGRQKGQVGTVAAVGSDFAVVRMDSLGGAEARFPLPHLVPESVGDYAPVEPESQATQSEPSTPSSVNDHLSLHLGTTGGSADDDVCVVDDASSYDRGGNDPDVRLAEAAATAARSPPPSSEFPSIDGGATPVALPGPGRLGVGSGWVWAASVAGSGSGGASSGINLSLSGFRFCFCYFSARRTGELPDLRRAGAGGLCRDTCQRLPCQQQPHLCHDPTPPAAAPQAPGCGTPTALWLV